MNDKIAIIVPVYNVEKYICRCLESILQQNFCDFELILVDDGSPDKCGEICEQYAAQDSRIIVIHQDNGGLSAARNTGIEHALKEKSIQWITFIDSDDWVHPDYLRALYNAAMSCNSDIAICEHSVTNVSNNVDGVLSLNAELISTNKYWLTNRTNATTAWGKLYRIELFMDVRYPVEKYHEDEYVTYSLLFRYPKVAYVNAQLYFYYQNGDGISKQNYLKRFPNILEAFQKHYDYFKSSKYPDVFRLEIEKYAEAYANAIYASETTKQDVDHLRNELKIFLKDHKHYIPFEKRKDIYIAAYPKQELFIRGFGFIKNGFKRL